MDCKMLRKRLDTLQSSRKVVEQQWNLVREYVVPYRGNFLQEGVMESSVNWQENRRVFDSTAINANNILASSIHGAVTNPSTQWFQFRFRDDKLSDHTEAAQWLHECGQIVFETLRDSNFNLQANECYLDLTSFGSAFITKEILEDGAGGFEDFLFQSIPLEEVFFEQDYRGRIQNVYRKMKWSAVQILSKFGDNTPDVIKEKAQNNATDQDITVVFAVYKREGSVAEASMVASPERRPYGYKYFLYEDSTQLGDEGGYYSMPALAMRWRKTSNSVWGNSPAMIAMPDIVTLNQLVELILDSLEKVVDPAIKVTERGLLSDLNLGPAGVNVLRSLEDMEAFESRARFDVAELNREKLQASIRSIFYVDQLELKEAPAMTATEVNVRYELMQRLLGPTLGRLESDFLDPLVSSAFADLMRYKRLPPMPAQVSEHKNPVLNIEYTGPMARAQKQDQAQSLTTFLGSVAQMMEVAPPMGARVDWNQAVVMLAEYTGVEPRVLKSEATMKKEQKQAEEQARRMQEAEIAGAEGQAMESIGKGEQLMRGV
jgi:hypothetical protein